MFRFYQCGPRYSPQNGRGPLSKEEGWTPLVQSVSSQSKVIPLHAMKTHDSASRPGYFTLRYPCNRRLSGSGYSEDKKDLYRAAEQWPDNEHSGCACLHQFIYVYNGPLHMFCVYMYIMCA